MSMPTNDTTNNSPDRYAPNQYALIGARFNLSITEMLMQSAAAELQKNGINRADIIQIWVPGAFELPQVCKRLIQTKRYAAIIALGAIIRGETAHFDLIAAECARGIMQLNLQFDTPVIFGVLTTDNTAQALHRADPAKKNNGAYAARAALDMVNLFSHL